MSPSTRPLLRSVRLMGAALPLALLAACTEMPADPPSNALAGNPGALVVGDTVKITVFGQDQLASEQMIGDDGSVTMPLAGRVKIAGQTPDAAEQSLAQRLKGGIVVNPSVTVSVTHRRPIYVTGEVAKPGAYDWQSDMRVLNAVAEAGGYTYRARTGALTVRRADDAAKNPVTADDATPLRPGDVVVVPERWF